MNTTLLRYMVEFAIQGTSQKAADSLGVSRSSITRGIRKLEDELGTQLFVNTPDGAVPTYAGDLCLRYARQILKIDSNLRFDLANDGLQSGTIHIGMGINRSQRVLPFVLPSFHKAYPNIQVQLHEAFASELEAELTSLQLDFAILQYPLSSPELDFKPLLAEKFVLVAPKGDIFAKQFSYFRDKTPFVTLEKFRGKPFVLPNTGRRSRIICDEVFQRAGIMPEVVFETKSSLNSAMLAYNGLGYTLVPESYTIVGCEEQIEYFYLEPDLEAQWMVGIATRSGDTLSHAAELLKTEIVKIMEEISHSELIKNC